MKNLIIVFAFLCSLPLGCATFSEQAKIEAFGRTEDSYKTAMQLSDFNTVCRYVHPSAMGRKDCLARYDNLKIVTYDVIGMDLSEDNREVTQTVDVEYYFLDRYIAKKLQYEQSWGYQEASKNWMLTTCPPVFK